MMSRTSSGQHQAKTPISSETSAPNFPTFSDTLEKIGGGEKTGLLPSSGVHIRRRLEDGGDGRSRLRILLVYAVVSGEDGFCRLQEDGFCGRSRLLDETKNYFERTEKKTTTRIELGTSTSKHYRTALCHKIIQY